MKCLFLLLMTFLTPSFLLAFNGDKCGNLFPKVDSYHPPYYSPFYATTMIPSTTSYFSSFGHCALYGDSMSGSRALFVRDTYDLIAQDAAQGSGEYLTTLAELSGCNQRSHGRFATVLKKNYGKLFPDSNTTELFLNRLDSEIQSYPELKTSCSTVN